MPDPSLHGNGHTCPACELRREADRDRTVFGSKAGIECNNCDGTGMNRNRRLAKRLATASNNPVRGMDRLITTLLREHDLLAELMAVSARKGPATSDDGFEYIADTDDPRVGDVWLHTGSSLPATHHLPEPHKPGGQNV